ncbi:MAG TPA: hypothetical protein VIY69_07495 [Candidatus Acidoferrales bacterium]
MRTMGVCKHAVCVIAAIACAGAAFLASGGSVAAKPPAPAGVNLYQEVIAHQASIKWVNAPPDAYPDDVCNYLHACSSDGSAPKAFILPVATLGGRRTARAVFLVKIKDPKEPEAVVFEHQTADQTYFFRVGPDGNITYTAYLEPGRSWLLIANQLGQPLFDKDAPDWHAALSKPAGRAGE